MAWRAHLAGLPGPRRRPRRPAGHRASVRSRAAGYQRLLSRPPPGAVVGRLPVVPGHRDQRGHHHFGAGHRLQGELGVLPVLRGLESGQVRGGVPVHPGLLPTRRHHHLRVPAGPLRPRQPGHGLPLLLRLAVARLRREAHGRGAGVRDPDGLAAGPYHCGVRARLDRLHRLRRRESGGVDERVPGPRLPGRGGGDARLSAVAHRGRLLRGGRGGG